LFSGWSLRSFKFSQLWYCPALLCVMATLGFFQCFQQLQTPSQPGSGPHSSPHLGHFSPSPFITQLMPAHLSGVRQDTTSSKMPSLAPPQGQNPTPHIGPLCALQISLEHSSHCVHLMMSLSPMLLTTPQPSGVAY
jgi:hypothetical protein